MSIATLVCFASPRLALLMLCAALLTACAESETASTAVDARSDAAAPVTRDLGSRDAGTIFIDLGRDGRAPVLYDGAIDGERPRETLAIPIIDPSQTSLPLCEDRSVTVNGLPGRPCAGMDGPCLRGIRDDAECCRQEPRWPGTGCGDGMACNTGGECLPTTVAPWEAASIVGDQTWLDILGEGEDSLLTHEPRGFQARYDNASLVDVYPDEGSKVYVGDVHIAHLRDAEREAVAIVAPANVQRRSVFLLTAPPNVEVCVVRGDFDTMGPVTAGCDSPGATRVRCPDGDADTVCDAFPEGGVRITGNDLALVFEMGTFGPQLPGTDVRRALTVNSLDHRWYTPRTSGRARAAALVLAPTLGCSPAECTFGQIRTQNNTCNGVFAVKVSSCSIFGCWGPYQFPAERCDGLDNDCDGAIDEGGGAALCNDNIGCTVDACNRLNPSSPFVCRNYPDVDSCRPLGDPNGQTCILPRCNVGTVAYGSDLAWPMGAPNVLTQVDSRGCSFLQRNDYCTDTWDSCDCNAREVCAPGSNLIDATGCRNTAVATGSSTGTGANAWVGNYPCEKDKLYCTFGECCEPDTRCRGLELVIPDPIARGLAIFVCNGTPGNVRTRSPTGKFVDCRGAEIPQLCPQNDSNPCTTQYCTEPLPVQPGAPYWGPTCPATPIGGDQPGCSGIVNEGCGSLSCTGGNGTCKTTPTGTATTQCSQGSEWYRDGEFRSPSCITSACSGSFCVRTPNSTLCEPDTLDCTNLPTCSIDPSIGTGRRRGCGPETLKPAPAPNPDPLCHGPVVCSEAAPDVSYQPVPGNNDWWNLCDLI